MTTHATEGALVSRARALRSQSGAVMSRKNGTTVSRGFRPSYGVIWPGRCPIQNCLDVYKFRWKVLTLYTATAPRKYLNLWQDNLRLSFSITAGLRLFSERNGQVSLHSGPEMLSHEGRESASSLNFAVKKNLLNLQNFYLFTVWSVQKKLLQMCLAECFLVHR